MRRSLCTASHVVRLFLLMLFCLVHCLGSISPAAAEAGKDSSARPKKGQLAPAIQYDVTKLPAPVQDMRDAILSAVKSGRIEELRYALELNELKPELADEPVRDPIGYWKRISADGEGWEILAALGEALEAGYVILPLGRDVENNKIYVWPCFAEVPLDKLTPAQEVELLRLVTPQAAKDMRAAGRYTHWRIVIGADGTWHSFRKP